MQFKQCVGEVNISWLNYIAGLSVKMSSGERKEENGIIRYESLEDVDIYVSNRCMEFLDKKLWHYIDEEIKKYENIQNQIELSIFMNFHAEKVEIENRCDTREYGYLKIVAKDLWENTYFKEIPIFFDDDICKVSNRIKQDLGIVENTILKKKKKLGKKEECYNNVIFSQQATGYFIHEVIGHLLEEDVFQFSKKYLENGAFNKKLQVIDNVIGYENVIGLNKIDDEGVDICPIELINNKKIENIISLENNKYGVARRGKCNQKVLPRMRCTYVQATDATCLETLSEKYTDAVVISNIYSGYSTFLNGDFVISGNGYKLVGGEPRYMLNNIELSGNIFDYLNKIDDIGEDVKIFPTECGKMGHIVRVGLGGPSMSFHDVKVMGDMYSI